MKTYRQFILEAELSWWNGGRPKAKSKESELRRERDGSPEEQVKRFSRLKKIESSIEKTDSRESDTKPKETAKQKRQRTNAVKNTGYAQTGKRGKGTPTSSVGTVSGVRRRTFTNIGTGEVLGPAEPSDTRTSGRYGKVTGGRGTGKSRSFGDIGR